jgi:hypothetical protein
MSAIIWARRSLPVFALAIAVLGARGVSAQAVSPSSADSTASEIASASLATVRVTAAAPNSRLAYERSLIVGNRLLAKELEKYDKRILELEKKLDSLRIAAAHRWRDAREMESAALAARERRIELERRLASIQAADTTRTNPRAPIAGPR